VIAIEWTDGWRAFVDHAAHIVGIIVVAAIANLVVRRAISSLSGRMQRAAVEVRSRAPSNLMRAEASKRAAARAEALSSVLRSVASIVIYTTALFMILSELGISLAPLIAGASVVSIAVGIGAQSLVRDVLTGIFVMIEDQYGVGDAVDLGVASGTVERISLRTTRVRDVAGTVWHVPNGAVVRVGNKSQNWARAVLDVVITSDSDVRRAREILVRVASDLAADESWSSRISGTPDDQGVQALTSDGITLRLVLDTEPASQWSVERELRLRVIEAFGQGGVRLAMGATSPPPAA
jgi:small conductance mechanosensitive channel